MPNLSSELTKCKFTFNPITFNGTLTPDYFNSCVPVNLLASTPINYQGNQQPYNGNAYLGFAVLPYNNDTLNNYVHETIELCLSEEMVAGKEYEFNFFLSLAENFYTPTDAIHVKFTTDTIDYAQTALFNVFSPDWENTPGNFFTDTVNWMPVTGKYTARGGEKFVIIGCLKMVNWSNFFMLDTNYLINAYYYIEDFSVYESTIQVPNVFSPNGDGINDLYTVFDLSDGDRIKIYNRWGTQVYESTGIKDGWDGRTTSGEQCSEGVYYYIIERKEKENRKGYIQLLR